MKNTLLFFALIIMACGQISAQYDFTTFDESDGLPDNTCRGIAVDSMGTLWVGTQNGLAKWDGSAFTPVPIDDGVENPFVNVVKVAPDGNIWVGYLTFGDELGLSVIDPDGNLILHADSVLRGEPGTWIYDIEFGPDGLVYIGINEGLVRYDGVEWMLEEPSPTGFPSAPHDILFDDDGSMWLGTFFGLAHQKTDGSWDYFFTLNSDLISDNIRTLEFGPDGDLWIGTNSGLSIFDGSSFTNYDENNGMSHEFVRDIDFDEMGRAWLMTDDGFSIFDGTGFQNFETFEHQFIENQIEDILMHPTHGIWMATLEGAVKVTDGMTPIFEIPQAWLDRVKIFPVPAADHVNVSWENDEMTEVEAVILLDVNGRPLRRFLFDASRNGLTLDLSSLAPGTYFLSFEMEKGRFVKRLVKG